MSYTQKKVDPNTPLWTVYRYSLPDGRSYIGQTSMTLIERAGYNGHRYEKCVKFWNAIKKYGWDKFTVEILGDHLTLAEANELEASAILKYDSINNGFNCRPGGDNYIVTEEIRQAMSERMKGMNNPNYGKPRPEEVKKKISISNHYAQLGKTHSEATKEKMRISHTKESKIVLCIETNEIYNGPKAAERAMHPNTKSNHISEVCAGKRKTAYGYHWRYLTEEEIKNNEFDIEMVKK